MLNGQSHLRYGNGKENFLSLPLVFFHSRILLTKKRSQLCVSDLIYIFPSDSFLISLYWDNFLEMLRWCLRTWSQEVPSSSKTAGLACSQLHGIIIIIIEHHHQGLESTIPHHLKWSLLREIGFAFLSFTWMSIHSLKPYSFLNWKKIALFLTDSRPFRFIESLSLKRSFSLPWQTGALTSS